jgi:hypothetical protein
MGGVECPLPVAFALRPARKLVRGLRHELNEDERYLIADDVVQRACNNTVTPGRSYKNCRRRFRVMNCLADHGADAAAIPQITDSKAADRRGRKGP